MFLLYDVTMCYKSKTGQIIQVQDCAWHLGNFLPHKSIVLQASIIMIMNAIQCNYIIINIGEHVL